MKPCSQALLGTAAGGQGTIDHAHWLEASSDPS